MHRSRSRLELTDTGDLLCLVCGTLRLRYRMQQHARCRKHFTKISVSKTNLFPRVTSFQDRYPIPRE